ncbi:hypothetical protein [Paenibacillus harenae]|uniref:ABC transporter permease n=1 Tax=Paenibacillus harenae TaxID=306543 RepID=A0ABT9U5X8_PAEHA|nr:hypothetical protein [Paenibacillus harenae]MDQ0115052.1 hypothetical protein [Paenibacillus harenae]
MKILHYEILKLFKKKVMIALIPLLLLSNCWIFIQQELNDHREIIEHREQYAAYEAQFRDLPIEQAYNLALVTRDKLGGFQYYLFIQQNQNSDIVDMFEADENYQRYGSLYPDSEYVNNEPLLLLHSNFNFTVMEQLEALMAYPDYVTRIEVQANNMLKYSIFNQQDSFTYRNILKTPKDFEEVKNAPLQLSLDYGVVSSTTFRMTDIMILTILLMLSIFIFSTEREQGQFMLLRTMKHGRARLFISKLQLLIGSTIFISLLFYGSIMLIANRLYGFGDGLRYIQSMGTFKFAHLTLTVNDYLTLFLIGKLMMCVVLALIFAIIFLLFNHLSKSFVVLALLLSSSYMAYQFIHPSSYINIFKYINIIAFFDTSYLLTNYVNLNLFGYPVNREYVSLFVIILLVLLLIVVCSIAFAKSSAKLNGSSWIILRRIMQGVAKIINGSSSISIIWHESIKQLWTAKGWIVLISAVLICVHDINSAKMIMDNDQYYYNEYMDKLSGPLTKEKQAFVEQEMKRMDNAEKDSKLTTLQYQAGEISFEQYKAAQDELAQLVLRGRAISNVYSQYQNLLEIKLTRNIDVYFVNQISADYVFNNVNRDQINVIIIGLLLTLYLASSYTLDHRYQLLKLLKTTKRGRLRYFTTVWLFGLGSVTLVLILIYIPQYINVLRLYPSIEWQAPIQSLKQFGALDMQITLKQLVVIVSICQWIGVLAISIVFLLLSHWLKRLSLTLLSGIVLVLCPTFTTWLGYNEVTKYTLHYPQVLYMMLAQQHIGEVYIYFSGLVALMIFCLCLSWHYNAAGKS